MKRILISTAAALMIATPALAFDMSKEGFTAVEAETVESATLEGAAVYTAADEEIGEISALVLDGDGKVEQAVIDVGGFLGLGEKPVAVAFEDLAILKEAEGEEIRVYIDATQESLEALPEYEG